MDTDEESEYDWVSTVASSSGSKTRPARVMNSPGKSSSAAYQPEPENLWVPDPLTPLEDQIQAVLRQLPLGSPRLRREIAEAPKCLCQVPQSCRLYLAQKEGPNYHRLFWRCNRHWQCGKLPNGMAGSPARSTTRPRRRLWRLVVKPVFTRSPRGQAPTPTRRWSDV